MIPSEMERRHIEIRGIVQGVGFRPFIHRKVEEFALKGWIRNTSQGVELDLEGPADRLDLFAASLSEDMPRMALIESIRCTTQDSLRGYPDFQIAESAAEEGDRTLISPDIGICSDCRRELFTEGDRRWRYPFINCTNCGPRFTIVRDLPYDRKNTSMAAFAMCPDCEREYRDIRDRRYHAQPDCCPVCGPRIRLLDGDGREICQTRGWPDAAGTAPDAPVRTAGQMLREGKLLAVKGLGGFHLACRPDHPGALERLRACKNRDGRPLALMCRDLEAAAELCMISEGEAALLESAQKPIVLLKKKSDFPFPDISDNGHAGIMLPYTPLHCLLMEEGPAVLVMTSANRSGEPIVYKNDEAVSLLTGKTDGILLHDRAIEAPCDDSVVRLYDGRLYPVRRSRGYVPYPVSVSSGGENILALGAEQKASFCFLQGEHAFLSQHIGDLKNLETLDVYESQVQRFEHLFSLQPGVLVCDRHPDYLSGEYGRELARREGLPLLETQHHHAHMASCMAENGLEGSCIGIVWDGTGFGMDRTIWGGEFLTGGYRTFSRAGSIRPVPLPGGDLAVREPWRTAAALLLEAGCDPAVVCTAREGNLIRTAMDGGLNCPPSSGMGRLFDGMSALCGFLRSASYEGQGAVLLEAAAAQSAQERYPVILEDRDGLLVFDWRTMVRDAAEELRKGVQSGRIAAAFMNTLVEMAAQICCRIRRETGLDRVVLSGGSFQNMYLMEHLVPLLEKNEFSVYHHSQVPPNDEGLSLGQAVIAARGGESYVPGSSAADRRD